TLTPLLPCVLLLVAGVIARADLAGHGKLDEGSGTTAFDSSGNGNDGTITDNSDLENVAWIAGVSGTALEFHGVGVVFTGGDYVDCGNDASLDITGPISIALWIRPDADDPEGKGTAGGETAPMAKADSGVGWSWQVRYGWGSGRLPYMGFQFAVGGSGTWVHVDRNLERYEWCHVACSHDGTTVRCYLNGEETDSTPLGQIDSSPAPVLIGSDGWLCDWTGGIDDVRIYNHGLTPEEILDAMLASGGPELAADPVPETEATDVPRDVVLGWSAGEFAATHDVYLGTVFTDVNDASHANPMGVLVSEGQAASTYDPEGPLEFGQTYYWRIDEVNAAPDNTIFKGLVWSFTVEPLGYPIENITATSNATSGAGEGPENTINGSGLNESDQHSTAAPDMWLGVPAGADPVYLQYEFDKVYKLHEMLVWNYNVEFELVLGFGLKNVAVEYSVDGADWTALGDAEFAQATARKDYVANTTVDFGGVAAKYVKLTVNSGHGMLGQFGLSEVRFLSVPVQAREPQPADGATDVLADTTLSWRAGREAASHDVYLGTDPEALVLADSVGEASYTPGGLEFGSTYYWQIVEVNEAEAISSWASDVWSLATREYAVIDDFESYDDEENRIYDTWLDGFVNGTGATVGYFEAPFAEQTIVNSGGQSMPLEYNNADAPFYSEAEVDLGSMNW
ncbi:MAG: LamG-like jellyroll fold domain-containing protein, partial [Planctomycetota bacterium]